VRCVTGLAPPGPLLNDRGDKTIYDDATGLLWMKCALKNPGTSEPDSTSACTDSHNNAPWLQALSACETLTFAGRTNWRLPSVREIASIFKYGITGPTIDSTYFPNTDPTDHWSSTTSTSSTTAAYTGDFWSAQLLRPVKSSNAYVRCVAGGP